MELTPATRYVWENAPYRFKRGAHMGPTQLSRVLHLNKRTVYYHLRKLETAGYVERVPRGRVKHVYAGVSRE